MCERFNWEIDMREDFDCTCVGDESCTTCRREISPTSGKSGSVEGYMQPEFEKWAKNFGYTIDRSHMDGKTPVNTLSDPAWQAWKAAIDKMRSI